MKRELLALAERVEAMQGPTCVMDALIAVAVGDAGENSDGFANLRVDPDDDGWLLFEMAGEACECCNRAPPYTASLDAAMSLVPSGIPWSVNYPANDDGQRSCHGIRTKPSADVCGIFGRAATPALALTAAALRARAAQEQ